MLVPGSLAPDFALDSDRGQRITLGDLLRDGPAIVFFYPADFTPVCTREACLIRDHYAELAASGFTVAGISPNDAESHARFREAHALEYLLLADPDKRAIRAYGVDGPLGIGVRRATFVIGPDRKIRLAVNAALRLSRHEALLREAIASQSAK